MHKVAYWVKEGDVSAFFWVNRSWRNSFYNFLMPVITHMGGAIYSIGVTLLLLFLDDPFWHSLGVNLAWSLAVSHLIVAIGKKVLPRPRPYLTLDDVCTGRQMLKDASFPSGHSTAAFSMATVFSYTFPLGTPIFFGIALLVGSSRVYLGLHYPSDILMGAFIGVMTAGIVVC